MVKRINGPSTIKAAGSKPKIIEEYSGRVNFGTKAVSIARMKSPGGWIEPGQTPEFDEYTVVLRGMLRVKTQLAATAVPAGPLRVSGFSTAVRYRRVRSISPSVYRCFHRPG